MEQIFESRLTQHGITLGKNTNDIILTRLIELSNENPKGSDKLMNKIAVLIAEFDNKMTPTVPIYWRNKNKGSWESSYRLNGQKMHLVCRKDLKEVLKNIREFCKEHDLIYPY